MSIKDIKVIAFDADDTLWVNEPFFRNAEAKFCELLAPFVSKKEANQVLFELQMQNLDLYGYGIKPFILSLMEAAIKISNGAVDSSLFSELIEMGKEMLQEPVVVLEGIEDTLEILSKKYRLVVATKGDLLDQERKLIKSGLLHYFHHIEIVSDKTEEQYSKLVKHLDITASEFLMIGNSLKSDVLPVLNIDGYAIHIPFHTTWIHEMYHDEVTHSNFMSFASATELLKVL